MEHPENYQIEQQQREIEREVKDVVDKREIGVIEEANKAADEVYKGTVEADKKLAEKDVEDGGATLTIPKDFNLELRDGIIVKFPKDTKVQVVGANTPEAIAGTIAVYPALYGAARESLQHEETVDLGHGRKVKRKYSYGAHGIQTITDEQVTMGGQTFDTTPAPGLTGVATDNDATIRRAQNVRAEMAGDPLPSEQQAQNEMNRNNANANAANTMANAKATTEAFNKSATEKSDSQPKTAEGSKAATAQANAKDKSAADGQKAAEKAVAKDTATAKKK